MSRLSELSVFFPAYNEEENIRSTVERTLVFLPLIADRFEVIIINDGSSDSTGDIARDLSSQYTEVRVITHKKNRGYGAAVKSGFAASRFSLVFFTDCDGQFDIRELVDFSVHAMGHDIVAGYRVKRKDPFYRLMNAKAYNLLVRFLFGLHLKDIDCAFKVIRKKVIDSVELKSESQFVSAEFLIKAKKMGFSIQQVGASHYPRVYGAPTGNSVKNIVNSFKELFLLWKELR